MTFFRWIIIVGLILFVLVVGYYVSLATSKHRTCASFDSQAAAQRWSDAHNHILDKDHDGKACEKLK